METKIVIHEEKNRLIWEKASEFIINWLKLYHNIGQKTLLLLSGGSMVKIYYDLAKFIKNSELNFDFLALGQIDERFRPRAELGIKNYELRMKKKDINANQIGKTGLWEECDEKKIPYYLVSHEGTLVEAAGKYNKQISDLFEQFIYKIGILGIGEDGHSAGLLPAYGKVWNIDKYVVGYDLRQNGPRGPFYPQFRERISMTPKSLIMMDQAIVVAVGQKKQWVIEKVLDPDSLQDLNKYPAAILQKIKKVDLFTDQQI